MKKTLLLALIAITCNVKAQKNMVLRAHMPFSHQLANIGSYSASGKEYALVGTRVGLSIVDVTNPDHPVDLFDIRGTEAPDSSIWREVKVWQHYAYVTTEGGGLQIIDLGNLPLNAPNKAWKGDGAIAGNLNSIHSLHIDNGYLYLYGGNVNNGGAKIVSLQDPWNPHYISTYARNSGAYVHDGYVRHDTLWACHIFNGDFSVVDVRDKLNPVEITSQFTPNKFTHNCWLSTNSKVLFTTDETDSSFLTTYDVSDLNNIKELDRTQSNPGSGVIVHNTQVINNYSVTSWYKDGVVIVDGDRPDNLIQVGNYDTSPNKQGPGYGGCWGVDPYLPSGTVVASDMENGLYVLTPTYKRGCYLEGIVTDSITNLPLSGVRIEIINTSATKQSKINGIYKTGIGDAGRYNIIYTKSGYQSRLFLNVDLNNGVVVTKNVKLFNGVLGINELGKLKATITSSPNPFLEFTTISYKLDSFQKETSLQVYNGLGQIIKNINLTSAEGNIRIDEDLSQGTYYAHLINADGVSASIKIMKLK
jgi:choice-of-anchor B domain-containing protein